MWFPWRRRTEPEAAPSPTPSPAATPSWASWRRRVLIVEDDAELWPVIERYSMRAQQGMQLEFAGSAEEAEQRLASGAHYDVVLADYRLPGERDGKKVLERADALQPWARVAMMSSQRGVTPWGIPFLPKPFTAKSYQRFLRELLGWGDPAGAV